MQEPMTDERLAEIEALWRGDYDRGMDALNDALEDLLREVKRLRARVEELEGGE